VKIFVNVCIIKISSLVQYHHITTNSRWWTAAILNIVKLQYFSEQSSNTGEIWYTAADFEHNGSDMTKNDFF